MVDKEAEEVKEILSVVSTQVPTLIKSILASVFSEEAGRSMGKAAGAYYKELKDSGMPEHVAVKMTEDYMRTFTNLGEVLKSVGKSGRVADIGEEISRASEKKRQEDET
ncbi:MAG: hypothetical protein OEY24_08330 [Candidatus Bathyarchaeota archaeon]|nr:hypothetical protein [Candidatus Bathyarchaeota archaeon]